MPAPDDLSPGERALVEHVERGELLDLSGKKNRTIRAEVIRDIMRGRLAPDPDPYGLRLQGAKIEGRVDLNHVTSTVVLDLRQCHLDEGLSARDANLVMLKLTGCRLQHTNRPALDGEGLRVDRWVLLSNGFNATAAAEYGAVCLIHARIDGQLDLSGATLRNDAGPALVADSLQVGQGLFLHGGFEATGAGAMGAVRLVGARVGSYLNCAGATMRNESGPALDVEGTQVGQNVYLDNGFQATSDGRLVTLNLPDLRIAGVLTIDAEQVVHRTLSHARINLEGLTYSEPPLGVTTQEWLRLLREGTVTYAAQPYQQFATALRAAGHDSEARRVLIQQRRDQLARGSLARTDRAWARVTGLTLGYGHQPWRALLALLGIVIISAVLALVLGSHGALVQAKAPTPCTVIDQVGTGLDLGTPLITTGAGTRCQLTSSATGQALTLTGWGLRLLAWAFATLFVAGFTNAVRKT